MPDVRHLRHLIAVAEHGNFHQAARAQHLSQPALTKSIQRFERELGVTLLDRSRRRVVPTPVGEVVIERARAVLSGLAELRREVALVAGREIGELTVGVGPAMSETFVTDAIARLAQKHPQVHITVRIDHWAQLSDWLGEGRIDLFVADTTSSRRDGHVRVISIPPQKFVWYCRREHPLASARRVTRQQLLQYPIVTPRMPEWARRWFAEAAHPDQEFDPDQKYGTVECENYTMLKRMVLAADCISAALQSTIADGLADGTLTVLPVKAPKLTTHAGIVHLRDRTLSPLAEAFIEEVLSAAGELLPTTA
jgi:DNA-binding transcriptional LysR family regulator